MPAKAVISDRGGCTQFIAPVVEDFAARRGWRVRGPVPADTAFTAASGHADAVLAMYHDQGLPVIKHAGFGDAVNVTLGLPIIRTSVDHGTAFDIAGTGKADPGSLHRRAAPGGRAGGTAMSRHRPQESDSGNIS